MPRRQGNAERDTKAKRRRRRTTAAAMQNKREAKRSAARDGKPQYDSTRTADLLVHADKENRPR